MAKSGETRQKLVSPVPPINFYNMTGLWMITGMGLLVSTVALFIELFIARRQSAGPQKSDEQVCSIEGERFTDLL